MRKIFTLVTLTAVVAATASQSSGQSEQNRPSNLPSDRNIEAFSYRAEGALLSLLRELSPVSEGYFQRFVAAEKLGYAPDTDRHILGRFRWTKDPEIEDLLNYNQTG